VSKLKIAMLVRQFSVHGGLELYAHKVVEGLLSEGVAVTVVCQERASDFQDSNLDFRMIEAPPSHCSKRARLEQLFRSANQALCGLADFDLIHSQHCPTTNADVVTFHNHSTSRLSKAGLWWEGVLNSNKRRFIPAYRLRDRHDELLLRRAYCLIFPAEVMKDDFFSAFSFLEGPPPKPYVVAHPGASMNNAGASVNDALVLPPQPEAKDGPFNFLFVGRGFRKKGLDILLTACCILKQKKAPVFRLLIAGLSAKPLDKMRLRLLGLKDCVEYLGFQKDMDAVYARARSIILPSRVEPFGMAPVQAMQRGVVPIVSRVAGVAEVLADSQDSLILNDHLDAGELADLMAKIMNEPELLKKLSQNGLVAAQRVNWQHTVAQTMKAYEIALKLKRSAAQSQA
jgi:glycosyltransferase involved in cell wall biosynthesis